eukprot:TRINITY_DN2755_c0_g1_i11.p1 TRINITY_DN2755_c0_g1~~TRINITY_DN2755_c0_g1_i11.p1  ORF type:complete len:161 (-),score=50.24 TRINITY_DN2755_c0_g1_i11:79-561(-)
MKTVEENAELRAKVKQAKETISTLNAQVTAFEEEFKQEKDIWERREQEILAQIAKLELDNSSLKDTLVNQRKTIMNLKKEHSDIKNLLKFQEAKAIEDIKSKFTAAKDQDTKIPCRGAQTSREPRSTLKHLPPRPNKKKVQRGDVVLKGMIFNPLKGLFN